MHQLAQRTSNLHFVMSEQDRAFKPGHGLSHSLLATVAVHAYVHLHGLGQKQKIKRKLNHQKTIYAVRFEKHSDALICLLTERAFDMAGVLCVPQKRSIFPLAPVNTSEHTGDGCRTAEISRINTKLGGDQGINMIEHDKCQKHSCVLESMHASNKHDGMCTLRCSNNAVLSLMCCQAAQHGLLGKPDVQWMRICPGQVLFSRWTGGTLPVFHVIALQNP
jgi:hypothetical protein